MQIRLYTMYFECIFALLSNYAAMVSETMQEPWRSLSCVSTVYSHCFMQGATWQH